MKVTIDTRRDTLEQALAVVALAFGSSANGATSKPERPARQAETPSRAKGSTRRAAAAAEPSSSTKAAAAKAPARSRTVSKPATAHGTDRKARRSSAKATATKTSAPRPRPANVAPPGQSDTIRAWARSRGIQVADAGRMSAAVITAYNAQHN